MSKWMKIGIGVIVGVPLCCALGLFALYLAQPTSYRIARTHTIAAPPSAVHAHLADLRAFAAWEPWRRPAGSAPPTLTFGPETSGPNAWMESTNMAESARLTYGEVTPTRVELRRDVLSDGVDTVQTFELRPVGRGTEVTWSFEGPMSGKARFLYPFLPLDRMFGGDMESAFPRLEAAALAP